MTKKSKERLERDQQAKLPIIKMSYDKLSNPVLHRALGKLKHAEVSGATASRINKVVKAVMPVLDGMREQYIETVQKAHDKRVEEAGLSGIGKGEKPTDEQLKQMDELNAQLEKENEAFGEKEVEIEVMPLAPQHLTEVKITAAELDALGELYDETGKVREAGFRAQLGIVTPETPSA